MNDLMKSLGVKPRRGKVITCPVCKKQFYVSPQHGKDRKTCSYKCMGIRKSKPKIQKICDWCGKECLVRPSVIKWTTIRGHKHFYCSRSCCSSATSGEGSSLWIHDRSKIKCRPNKIAKHKQWRNDIFARDNFICAICGLRGKYLEPHHIKRWHDFPSLRYEISNGITLHRSCHYLTRGKEELWEPFFLKRLSEGYKNWPVLNHSAQEWYEILKEY